MSGEDGSWEGIQMGDLVQYREKQFLFRGINSEGGPGMDGKSEPVFGMPKPSLTFQFYVNYYLRNFETHPSGVPQHMRENMPPMKMGHLDYVAFLNANRSDLNKVRHIPEDEWLDMIKEMQTKVRDVAKKASKLIAKALEDRDYYMNIDVRNPHIVPNPPIFGVGGCGCGCAPAFQFYLDEQDRMGITLPSIYESNFWSDDKQRTKQRSLEVEVKKGLGLTEVSFTLSDEKSPDFVEPFMR